ncbi:Clp protease N-terminal domain-containing protein, partial [Anaerosporobacter sp.]
MNDRFTANAKEALQVAADSAYRLMHSYIGTEHLLIGLIEV